MSIVIFKKRSNRLEEGKYSRLIEMVRKNVQGSEYIC